MRLLDKFDKFANRTSEILGHPVSFMFAVGIIIVWTVTGPYFNWSNFHLLIINTITTIITFLVGFLILNTANRSNRAQQLKLDELIRAVEHANNTYVKLEERSTEEIKQKDEEIKQLIEDNTDELRKKL